jgi:alpha-beta hydrolase superfamily lysophospholipase
MTEEPQGPVQATENSTAAYHRGRVTTADQLDLVCQSWTPASPRGVIVIIHGLAEHAGRYRETAQFLSANGWAVYAFDLRAHGHSPDPPKAGRVHINRFADYFLDVDAMIKLAQSNHEGLPLFILGHSMGGLISISFALQKPDGLAGVIVSSPALGTHPDFQPPLVLKLMVSILSRITPRLLVDSNLDTLAISRDPDIVQAYVNDPLISQKVSTRWYNEIIKAIKSAHHNAPTLRIPMLLMQSGADRLVDPDAPRRFSEAAPGGLVDLVIWDGLYHEMFNEPEKDRVRQRVLDWLRDRG